MSGLSIAIPERGALDVVGLGEISHDRLVRVAHWPEPGDKLDVLSEATAPGGQVASAILGCARLGLRAGLIGAVGDDDRGGAALSNLRADGVELSAVQVLTGVQTRTALILVSATDGSRAVLAQRDPRLGLAPARRVRAHVERARLLLVDATDPDAALWAARVARESGIPVLADLDAARPELAALLAATDFPVVTKEFAEEWGGTGRLRDGLERLTAGGASLAVATCGAEGAVARLGGREIVSPALPGRVEDTTGAGDAFHAGFAWGLLEGLEPEAILRFANAAAVLCCEARGAQAGLPTRAQVEARLNAGPAPAAAGAERD
jgi:sugar/nucleoside kinase (ribokinase family)